MTTALLESDVVINDHITYFIIKSTHKDLSGLGIELVITAYEIIKTEHLCTFLRRFRTVCTKYTYFTATYLETFLHELSLFISILDKKKTVKPAFRKTKKIENCRYRLG